MKKIEGPIFAIVTPFDRSGKIDFGSLGEYLAFLEEYGVQNIIVNGTTGEFASLTFEERKSVLEYCRSQFPGCVMAHISACAVKDCVMLLEHASEYADAALVLPPYYYSNATAAGLQTFFVSVIQRTTLPIYLYNFPAHTNIELKPELLTPLRKKFSRLRGVKDSSGNLDSAMQFKLAERRLQIFLGSEHLAFSALDNGLEGSVTATGNAVPECLVGMYKAFIAGRKDIAREWQRIFDIWNEYRARLDTSEIAATKAGLRARLDGFPVYVRPPLSALVQEAVNSVRVHIAREIMPAVSSALAS